MESTTLRSAAVTTPPPALLDDESRVWLRDLRSEGRTRDEAVARLHDLLLRGAEEQGVQARDGLVFRPAVCSKIAQPHPRLVVEQRTWLDAS